MTDRLRIRVLDAVVEVELDSSLPAPQQEAIRWQWAHLDVARGFPVDFSRRMTLTPDVGDDARPTIHSDSADHAADRLASEVTLAGIGHLAGRALMLHAAGVATADGRVIGLIGPSGRGKTTAAIALGQDLGYVTDECLAILPDGTVISYPKPLSIGARPGVKTLRSPADLGMTVATSPLQLAALVLLERDPDVAAPLVESVSLTDALAELVPQSSSLSSLDRPLELLADLATRTGGIRRVVYGDASQLPALVPHLLATVDHDLEQADRATPLPARDAAGGIRRAPFVDAAVFDSRLVVLAERVLHTLDGIGPAIWEQATGVTLAELTDRVVDAVGGVPDDVDALGTVATAVAEMLQAGILVEDAAEPGRFPLA